jgi:uncharacterized damage-inducible protein DinB
MKDFYKELFTYGNYINTKLIALFLSSETPIPEKALVFLSHIINTQRVWNNRIERDTTDFGIWELQPLDTLQQIEQENFERSLYLVDTADLERMVHYTNSRGEQYDNTIKDILFHVINHSTHHRAQIASVLKSAGIEPLITDYIFYKRKSV